MSKKLPTPVKEVSGCKVGWLFFKTREDAEAYVEGVQAEAAKQWAAGYDFGYCLPGEIRETDDGLFQLTIP